MSWNSNLSPKTAEMTEARCSLAEMEAILEESIKTFRLMKPSARIDSFNLEMQVVKEVWTNVLNTLVGSLEQTKERRKSDDFHGPEAFTRRLWVSLEKSRSIRILKQRLGRMGYRISDVGVANPIGFEKSDLTWRELAKIPGNGIRIPGVIEFTVGD